VLLLDFDGTLAPIVDRPEQASLPAATRIALEHLRTCDGVSLAIVSGRGLPDVRARAGVADIAYAGNHGMEIEGPGIHRVHGEAERARPRLESVAGQLRTALAEIEGAIVEDKGLTLSVHFRLVRDAEVANVDLSVRAAAEREPTLHVTTGKKVLEVRPRVDWHKGRAVEFLLAQLDPPEGSPVLYLGDDTTDEDAFRALQSWTGGEGVLVGDPAQRDTAAACYLRDPAEVATLLEALARAD
jgi:trehalose 6-phosphate phosphatase